MGFKTTSAAGATTAASSGSGSSIPLVSLIASIYAYCTVPTFGAAGWMGVIAAGGVGIATGIATGFFAGLGALAGIVTVGAAAAVVGLAFKRPAAFGIAGAAIGGLTGFFGAGYVAMTNTYSLTKDVAVDIVQDHQNKQRPEPASVAAMTSITNTANTEFAASSADRNVPSNTVKVTMQAPRMAA